jgi:DNA-binding IclR family transcriptional regulator
VELQNVKKQGYAVDHEEYEICLREIAVPIKNYTGQTIAALCVAGVSVRLEEERIAIISSYLRESGRKIYEKLCFS